MYRLATKCTIKNESRAPLTSTPVYFEYIARPNSIEQPRVAKELLLTQLTHYGTVLNLEQPHPLLESNPPHL